MNPLTSFLELSFFGHILFLVSFVVVAYFGVVRAGLSIAPWVPTRMRDLKRVHKLCDLKSGDIYVEAGCGNARVTKFIARNNPNVQCVGIEYSSIMVLFAKIVALFSRLPNLKIIYGDALKYDFSKADVVYTYGLSKTVNQKLLPKAKRELRPGSRLVSYAFEISGKQVQVDIINDSSSIYVYTQPL